MKVVSLRNVVLACAFFPLGLGAASLLLWLVSRADVFILLWFVSFYAGLVSFLVGTYLTLVLLFRKTDDTPRAKRIGRALVPWLALLAAFPGFPTLSLLVISTCPVRVTAPASPEHPAWIALVDYGDHSSLILPSPEGFRTEFAFGDWAYYAENDQGIAASLAAVLWPTQGTLGRRDFGIVASGEALRKRIRCQAIHFLKVEKAKAVALWKKLVDRHTRRRMSEVKSARYGLRFVPDPDSYFSGYNCNDAVVAWLRQTGCDVEGSSGLAIFEIGSGAAP